MSKKLPINVPVAAGFFSPETIRRAEEENAEKAAPINTDPSSTKVKNKGGRPKALKKKSQFTLTMDPDLYAALKDKAAEKQKSFSQLVTDTMLEYLRNN